MDEEEDLSSSCERFLVETAMQCDNPINELSFSSSIGSDDLAQVARIFDQPSENSEDREDDLPSEELAHAAKLQGQEIKGEDNFSSEDDIIRKLVLEEGKVNIK